MGFLDVVFLVLLAHGLWAGHRKGLASQMVGILGMVGSFTVAYPIAAGVATYTDNLLAAWAIAFIIIWGVAILAGKQLKFILGVKDDNEHTAGEEANEKIGAVIGLAKGFCIWLFLTFVLISMSERTGNAVTGSWAGNVTAKVLSSVHGILPKQFHERIEFLLDHLKAEENGTTIAAPPAAPSGSSVSGDGGNDIGDAIPSLGDLTDPIKKKIKPRWNPYNHADSDSSDDL